jgi:hypothetical protein
LPAIPHPDRGPRPRLRHRLLLAILTAMARSTPTFDPSFDPMKAWEQAADRIRRYSPEEALQSLVSAGILTKKGNPRAPYRGVIVKKDGK